MFTEALRLTAILSERGFTTASNASVDDLVDTDLRTPTPIPRRDQPVSDQFGMGPISTGLDKHAPRDDRPLGRD